MIRLEQVSKSFGTNQVLNTISMPFDHPGITAILGPNASGKTTLIKCILDVVIPDTGEIWFGEKKTRGNHYYRNHIGHLPQIAHFPQNLTARQILQMIKNIRGEAVFEQHLIELFGLKDEMAKPMRNLSGGTKQKVNLVMALMFDCPVIILDEPSTGLDPLSLKNLKDFLAQRKHEGIQILITTHIMSLVQEIADYIIFLLDGRIYFNGKMGQLLTLQGESSLENAIAKILKGTYV